MKHELIAGLNNFLTCAIIYFILLFAFIIGAVINLAIGLMSMMFIFLIGVLFSGFGGWITLKILSKEKISKKSILIMATISTLISALIYFIAALLSSEPAARIIMLFIIALLIPISIGVTTISAIIWSFILKQKPMHFTINKTSASNSDSWADVSIKSKTSWSEIKTENKKSEITW